jgi:hypothetical protein
VGCSIKLFYKLNSRLDLAWSFFNFIGMKWLRIFAALMLFWLGSFSQQPGFAGVSDDSISSVALKSSLGKKTSYTLSEAPFTVFVFLSPECPLSRNYTRTLNELYNEFSGKASFVGVVPGKSYSLKEIRSYSKDFKISFRIFNDPQFRLSTILHASVTPEVVLVSDKGSILYRGAIDDWVISLGKKKERPTIHYLKNAIQQSLDGTTVSIPQTKPVGCLINDF